MVAGQEVGKRFGNRGAAVRPPPARVSCREPTLRNSDRYTCFPKVVDFCSVQGAQVS